MKSVGCVKLGILYSMSTVYDIGQSGGSKLNLVPDIPDTHRRLLSQIPPHPHSRLAEVRGQPARDHLGAFMPIRDARETGGGRKMSAQKAV